MKITFVRDDLEEETEERVEVEEGTTVSEFLESRGVERQEVLVAKNGTIVAGSHELDKGDILEVFDVIAGG